MRAYDQTDIGLHVLLTYSAAYDLVFTWKPVRSAPFLRKENGRASGIRYGPPVLGMLVRVTQSASLSSHYYSRKFETMRPTLSIESLN